jgi:hypothetical protein
MINGNYTQGAGGSLAVDIGGTTPSSDFQDPPGSGNYDVVAVTGAATLGGSLSVSLINGFDPAYDNDDTFTILTATGLSGTFNTIYNGRVTVNNDSGNSLTVTFDPVAPPVTYMITLGNYAPLSAAWTVQNSSPPSGSVTFADAGSVGAITSWVVNFGDGSPNYTYNVSPGSAGGALAGAQTTHIYASGSYTATLTVHASDGSSAQTTSVISFPSVSLSLIPGGTTLILYATGEKPDGDFSVLESANVALPLTQWTTYTTGNFSEAGTVDIPIPLSETTPCMFYVIEPTAEPAR